MPEAQCICKKKRICVPKYCFALQGKLFTFSYKEAVEMQGYHYSFPPWNIDLSHP